MIGSTISHYRVIERLGEGGMGVVYRAEDIALHRNVAIKVLSSTTPEYRARFLREAQVVSGLIHPNIATVFDYGETTVDYGETAKGTPYIVMELVNGEPLNEKLYSGPLPLREAVRVVSAIAEALNEAHHHGVVHRDVKPSNVVIANNGLVKVLDFGLVKHLETPVSETANTVELSGTRTRSDVIVGTPLYLSPEQAMGKKADVRSDLFALGAVLYECITGQSAFAGSSVIEIGAQVIHVTPALPSKVNPAVPAELDRITMRALEKKADARYQTAQEFNNDLRDVLASLPETESETIGRPTRYVRPARTRSVSALTTINESFRRPRLSLAAFILIALGVSLAGWLLYQWRKPSPYRPTPAALDFYNKGTDALRNGAFLQASKAFEQAVANDPNFALAHARLAEAYSEMDYSDKAKNELLRVQALVPDRSALVRTDALHLEAINATVSNDFVGATKAYSDLASLAPNDPQVYVDLGRAYEKNDEIKKAIESYVDATNRTAQYATAFLRVGILYGRQGDRASAFAAFDKAEKLYQADGNFEGQSEVSYQRGYLFNQLGMVAEGRQHLQQALEIARPTGNDYQQVKTLLKLGDIEIDAGRIELGRQYIQSAFQLAQAKGIDNYTKRALVDLGNSFIVSGQYDEAEKYFRESLELSRRQNDVHNAARALLALGSLAERRHRADDVVKFIEQAMPFYQQGGYRKETIQALHLLARAKVQKGDYEVASKTFDDLLKVAQQLNDPFHVAIVYEDMGLLRLRQGQYPRALEAFEESYKIAKSLGIQRTICWNLINRANAFWRLGRFGEAQASLKEALHIAEGSDANTALTAAYYLAKARLAFSEGQLRDAESISRQAASLAGTQVKTTAISATYTLGRAKFFAGTHGEARSRCGTAVAMARELGDPYLVSEALLAMAEALVQNESPEALKAALEASELFAGFGNQDNEWLALVLAARAARAIGDNQQADAYAAKAESLLSKLKQQWGQENYDSYLNRSDVQISRKQLSELIAGNPNPKHT